MRHAPVTLPKLTDAYRPITHHRQPRAACFGLRLEGWHPAARSSSRIAAVMEFHGIDIPQEKIAAFCRRHRIRRLALFGSILRDDFAPESDIDVLVEFEAGATPGWDFFGMQQELTDILGHKVDLNTPAELSRYFRDEVLREARELYVAA